MRIVSSLPVLAACLLFAAADLFAHPFVQDRNSITGFVFGEAGRPLANLYVELQTDTFSTVGRAQTNGSGMFSFTGLRSGVYIVKVLSSGTEYDPASQSVSLLPVSPVGRGAMSEQVNFQLRLRSRGDRGTPPGPPGSIFVQDIPAEARSLYDSGVHDLSNARESEGLEKIRKAIEAFPQYYAALDRLGSEYTTRGHYPEAVVLLSEAVRINPRSFTSTFGLGLAEFRLNRFNEAVEQFRNAVKLDKESVNANLWLGISLHASGQFSDALGSLKKANTLSNGSVADVHWQLARVYKDMNRFSDSAAELELYLKLNPKAPNAAELRQVIQHLREKR